MTYLLIVSGETHDLLWLIAIWPTLKFGLSPFAGDSAGLDRMVRR
jgi:hypothetical protein